MSGSRKSATSILYPLPLIPCDVIKAWKITIVIAVEKANIVNIQFLKYYRQFTLFVFPALGHIIFSCITKTSLDEDEISQKRIA